jgi:hypothetical protein
MRKFTVNGETIRMSITEHIPNRVALIIQVDTDLEGCIPVAIRNSDITIMGEGFIRNWGIPHPNHISRFSRTVCSAGSYSDAYNKAYRYFCNEFAKLQLASREDWQWM